jgi:two-component system nitrogen regulation sensor histidine kinase NtrY
MDKAIQSSNNQDEMSDDISIKSRKNSFWRGFMDAFLGPKNSISGLRRRFSSKSWATRFSFILIALAIISGFATYAALTETPPFGDDPNTVIWLLNLDLIILLLLATLIGRRIVSIWSGRRRNIAGSRLHVRLVLIFSVMAAVPAIIMAVFSAFFFHFGVQTWFSENVRTAVYESQAVAESYLEEHSQVIKADILAMANDIDRQASRVMDPQSAYNQVLDTQSLLRNLSEAMIFDESGKILARSNLTFTLTFENVPNYLLEQAQDGEVIVLNNEEDDRLRALVKLNSGNGNFLFVGRRVDPGVLSHLEATKTAADRYTELEGRYSGLQITVTMIFVVVALLLLLAAMWVGIVLARQLVIPISTLISTSDRVRAGDLTARVPRQEQIEEFDYVAQSFNRMTSQLQQQRDELISANRQLDHRRRLTETVLTGVSAGVVGVNSKHEITLANSAACEMFERAASALIGSKITDILEDIEVILEEAHENPNKIKQTEIPFINSEGQKLTLTLRIAIELIGDEEQGAVLTFDDITELQSAQRKAAWADVARRIAHEIKNPLTPIQLSAERLKRKYLKEIESDKDTFEICTDTIIRHVEDIGRMVNEFSDFARMPESIMKPAKIISELQDLITFQKAAHPKIKFNIKGNLSDKRYLEIPCDIQQIRQAVTNLLQNSIDSIEAKAKEDSNFKGQINILMEETLNDGDHTEIIISLIDNGLGLPENEDANKLSEPYVTHRERGTGLGLAIVKKIMSDHDGQLLIGEKTKVKNLKNWEDLGGATISLSFPVASEIIDQQEERKQAS